jgi:hypothetical protein
MSGILFCKKNKDVLLFKSLPVGLKGLNVIKERTGEGVI